jgi:hypothetical protein
MITIRQALNIAKRYHIDLSVVPINELKAGLNIELEHGSELGSLTNITNDSLDKTMRIVLAHLQEDPRYYKYLKHLEIRRKHYWRKHHKPSIFNEYRMLSQKKIKRGEIAAGNNSNKLKEELKKITAQLSQANL